MKNIFCRNCKKESIHHAKGLCLKCYKKIIWRSKKRICVKCNRERYISAKGMCGTCYGKTFHRKSKEAYQARKLYGINYDTWKEKTKICVICGFDKIVDLHHLDKNHENRDSNNLIGLCPNHHRMLHKSEHRSKMLLLLNEKGFKV